MASDEVLAWIKVPKAASNEFSRVYKVSKRFEDDISAVCLAISLQIDGGLVASASIGVGGVAATPVRARAAEKVLLGAPWNVATVERAAGALQAEFQPISDMRASAGYRKQVLVSLLQRFWLESQGTANTQLANLSIAGEPA
jgi:xanthine dehydrogenase small subunit